MAERSKVKITVLKKFKPTEVFGDDLLAETNIKEACAVFNVGQEFIIGEDAKVPEGFCLWAWNDLYTALTHLRFGGDFPWMKEKGSIIACCSDGLRPVIFKLERIK
jgi:uncharacterized repeat protein (TIGR04076 family)